MRLSLGLFSVLCTMSVRAYNTTNSTLSPHTNSTGSNSTVPRPSTNSTNSTNTTFVLHPSNCLADLTAMMNQRYISTEVSALMLAFWTVDLPPKLRGKPYLVAYDGYYEGCRDLHVGYSQPFSTHCLLSVPPVTYSTVCVPISCSSNLKESAAKFLKANPNPKYYKFGVISSPLQTITCGGHARTSFTGPAILSIVLSVVMGTLVLVAWCIDRRNSSRAKHSATVAPLSSPRVNVDSNEGGDNPTKTINVTSSSSSSSASSPATRPDEANASIPYKMLMAFSFTRTWAALTALPASHSPSSPLSASPSRLTVLDGLRTLSMFWIILGHTANFLIFVGFTYPTAFYGGSWTFLDFIFNANFAVDTFFFLSGFLLTLIFTKRVRQAAATGRSVIAMPFKGIAHRYVRLMPLYATVIIFFSHLVNNIGEGPFWNLMEAQSAGCRKYWWTNIIFINNFYPTVYANQCLPWTWFLANDFQFTIVGLFIIVIYTKSKPAAWLAAIALMIASFIIQSIIFWRHNMHVIALAGNDQFQDMVYDKPYCRVPAYLVGMMAAFLDLENIRIRTRRQGHAAVGSAVVLIAIMIFGFTHNIYPTDKWNLTQNMLFSTFTRPVWALAVALITAACRAEQGFGGIVEDILSSWCWSVLGKLTLAAYLLHPMIIRVVYYNRTRLISYRVLDYIVDYLGFLVLAYASAAVAYCTVEAPFTTMETLVTGKKEAVNIGNKDLPLDTTNKPEGAEPVS